MPDPAGSLDPHTLERTAAAILADALAQEPGLHLPGERERHRSRLDQAIDLANRVLALAEAEAGDPRTLASARSTLVKAHAARARDARHGAGQLSLGRRSRQPRRVEGSSGGRGRGTRRTPDR